MTDGLREEIAAELARHQGLRGPMEDDRPDVWQNRCECGWDDGDEHPGWRERYRLHVADAVLALPAVRDLLAAAEAVQRVEALADHYRDLCMWDEDGRRRTLHRSVSDRIRRALDGTQ